MKLLLVIALLCASLSAQIPDAPSTVKKCGPWSCWNPDSMMPAKEALKSKTLWAYFSTALMADVYDSEMTHEGLAHHRCVEANVDPPYPSRADLYRNDIPDAAAIFAAGFILVRVHAPKWLLWSVQAAPDIAHIKGGTGWRTKCW